MPCTLVSPVSSHCVTTTLVSSHQHCLLVVRTATSPLSRLFLKSWPEQNREQAAEIAAALIPAGPDHPWPERIGSGAFGGSKLSVPLIRVEPLAVAEVSADAALTAGVFRHPLRFLRLRPDLSPTDAPSV